MGLLDFLWKLQFKLSFAGIIAITLGIGVLIAWGAAQKRYARLRSMTQGLLVSYITIVLILTAGEVYFRYGYAESGWLWTLAGQNWHTWYVERNTDGFRDQEWQPEDYAGKTTVLLFGDSFTEGFGIKDTTDRYGDVLAALLGAEYAVMNIGVANTSTRDQWECVLPENPPEGCVFPNNPYQNPDILIWQYFINDINGAALSVGEQWWPKLPPTPPRWIDRESYLANYLYWRVAPHVVTVDVTHDASYWGWAYRIYDNPGIWQIHEQELNGILAYVDSVGARLIVLIFPNPLQPVESIPYVDRVAQYLRAQGVDEILPLYDDIAAFPGAPQSVVVSPRDFHTNAAFNRYLGQKIFETFFAFDEAGGE